MLDSTHHLRRATALAMLLTSLVFLPRSAPAFAAPGTASTPTPAAVVLSITTSSSGTVFRVNFSNKKTGELVLPTGATVENVTTAPMPLSDVQVGDQVVGTGTLETGSTYGFTLTVLRDLDVTTRQVTGTVASVNGSAGTLTINADAGQTLVLKLSSGAQVTDANGKSMPLAGLVTGQRIRVSGMYNTRTNAYLHIDIVQAVKPGSISGTVTAIASSADTTTLTVSISGGGSATLLVTATSSVSAVQVPSLSPADIGVGDRVQVTVHLVSQNPTTYGADALEDLDVTQKQVGGKVTDVALGTPSISLTTNAGSSTVLLSSTAVITNDSGTAVGLGDILPGATVRIAGIFNTRTGAFLHGDTVTESRPGALRGTVQSIDTAGTTPTIVISLANGTASLTLATGATLSGATAKVTLSPADITTGDTIVAAGSLTSQNPATYTVTALTDSDVVSRTLTGVVRSFRSGTIRIAAGKSSRKVQVDPSARFTNSAGRTISGKSIIPSTRVAATGTYNRRTDKMVRVYAISVTAAGVPLSVSLGSTTVTPGGMLRIAVTTGKGDLVTALGVFPSAVQAHARGTASGRTSVTLTMAVPLTAYGPRGVGQITVTSRNPSTGVVRSKKGTVRVRLPRLALFFKSNLVSPKQSAESTVVGRPHTGVSLLVRYPNGLTRTLRGRTGTDGTWTTRFPITVLGTDRGKRVAVTARLASGPSITRWLKIR